MFFNRKDRRRTKENSNNIVFTSNRNSALRKGSFSDNDSLLCPLDEIFDDTTVFTRSEENFRVKNFEEISLQTSKNRALSEIPVS